MCITVSYELAVIIYPHLTDKLTEAEKGLVICPSNRASVEVCKRLVEKCISDQKVPYTMTLMRLFSPLPSF